MTPSQQYYSTMFLALIVAIPGIIAAIAAAYNIMATRRVQEGLKEVKLTVDPLTGVLDGQLTEMKDVIRESANLQGRQDLLAEQALVAAAVLQQVVAAATPIPVKVVAEEPVPVMVAQETVPVPSEPTAPAPE